jgi:hypothetical protein
MIFLNYFLYVLRAGVKKDYGSMNPALCEMGGHLLTTG